jgi:hypothetical protein
VYVTEEAGQEMPMKGSFLLLSGGHSLRPRDFDEAAFRWPGQFCIDNEGSQSDENIRRINDAITGVRHSNMLISLAMSEMPGSPALSAQ